MSAEFGHSYGPDASEAMRDAMQQIRIADKAADGWVPLPKPWRDSLVVDHLGDNLVNRELTVAEAEAIARYWAQQ